MWRRAGRRPRSAARRPRVRLRATVPSLPGSGVRPNHPGSPSYLSGGAGRARRPRGAPVFPAQSSPGTDSPRAPGVLHFDSCPPGATVNFVNFQFRSSRASTLLGSGRGRDHLERRPRRWPSSAPLGQAPSAGVPRAAPWPVQEAAAAPMLASERPRPLRTRLTMRVRVIFSFSAS